MKRPREDTAFDSDSEDVLPTPKIQPTPEKVILQDLERELAQNDQASINQQLLNTQKQYFTMYMEKLMHQLPMGKAIIDTVRKNGHANDFMYMYTASKTIVQSMMSVKQHKAMKSIVDMMAGIVCRYMHDKVITPMLKSVMEDEHLKLAYHAYQTSVKQEENDNELEMRCLLHTIHQTLENQQDTIHVIHPFQTQLTQQMKAVSDYVVALLITVSKPQSIPEEIYKVPTFQLMPARPFGPRTPDNKPFFGNTNFATPDNKPLFTTPDTKPLFATPDNKPLFTTPDTKPLFATPDTNFATPETKSVQEQAMSTDSTPELPKPIDSTPELPQPIDSTPEISKSTAATPELAKSTATKPLQDKTKSTVTKPLKRWRDK